MLGSLIARLLGRGSAAASDERLQAAQAALTGSDHARAQALAREQLATGEHAAAAWSVLGLSAKAQGDFDAAQAGLEQALTLVEPSAKSDRTLLHTHLGQVLWSKALTREALAEFHAALALDPDYHKARSALLYCLSFAEGIPPEAIAAEYAEFGRRHALPLQVTATGHANPRDPARRLRVGYSAFSFANRVNLPYLEPVFRAHDPARVELVLFDDGPEDAQARAMLGGLVQGWHQTRGMDDERFAALVREQGIDVLVDLSGHLNDNRLLAFARGPAPVQASWLSYPQSTGVPAIGYRITDAHCDPAGSEHFYNETLLRLPHSYWCYAPPEDPAPGPLPALSRGPVTFGSFNNHRKISDASLALWAKLLARLPDARMHFVTVPPGASHARILAAFAREGVAGERIRIDGWLSEAEYRARWNEVDIALDPFPYNGATTTLDALWMGVPVVTLAGNTCSSRAALSILTSAGLPEFVAHHDTGYLDIAAALAADLPALSALRSGLRTRMRASPLMDAPAFSRALEDCYFQAWRAWCARPAN
jgi:protein O-GlcNAc transferase